MKLLSIKDKAIDFRQQGYSYSMISQELGLAKSTLSDWLRDIPFNPNEEVLKRIGMGRLKSAQFKYGQRIRDIKKAKELAKIELGNITRRDLWILGIGLYIGEGAKNNENIRIINSDPQIICIAIRWFKDICKLSNNNFVPSVHLYPDTDIPATLEFWSNATGIDINQFGKTQIDLRKDKVVKKRGKLPYGTLHLQVKSCGKKEFGRFLHRRIIGWIEECISQIN